MEKNDSSFPIRKEIVIKIKGKDIAGSMEIPAKAKGLVIFAHGSGSSRFSPRNRYVAGILNKNNLGTLLFDLLTAEEEKIDEYTAEYRFNIQLLAERLEGVTDWLLKEPSLKGLKLGYFGASTGAAAALIAAPKDQTLSMPSFQGAAVPTLPWRVCPGLKRPRC
jgi:hypothetical protein